MKYVCLIYEDPTRWPAPGADTDALFKSYWEFTEQVKAAGKLVGGDPLERRRQELREGSGGAG